MERRIQFIALVLATFMVYLGCVESAISQQDYTLWHLPDGAVARLGKGGTRDIAFSPDGTILAVATSSGVWLYDAHTQKELALLTGPGSGNSVSFSPDGKMLLTSRRTLWSVSSRQRITNAFKGDTRAVTSVSFSSDGEMLASGGTGGMVRLWSIPKQEKIGTLMGHTDYVVSLSF